MYLSLTKRRDKNMLKYIVTVALIATLATTSSAGYIDECSQLATCADCLAHDYCGWCSPYPVVYENGTKGARCGDQRDAPWTCNNLYQTKQCIRGYKCDATNGQCVLAAPGEGDTLKNCEAGCKVEKYYKCDWSSGQCSECKNATDPGCTKYGNGTDCSKACSVPEDLYKCDADTLQCNSCGASSYCKTNADCPGSYCQITGPGPWTCHGSTCQQKYQCQDACGLSPELLGIWRGFELQDQYTSGEFDMKIQNAKPQFTLKLPDSTIYTGNIKALDKQLNITLDDGTVLACIYEAWEPSPETENFAFACGSVMPSSITAAMNGKDFKVLFASKCKPKSTKCDFSSVFTGGERKNSRKLSLLEALKFTSGLRGNSADPCNQFKDCSTCLNAPSGLCGWCDTPVVYSSGAPGANCAGFDKEGKASPSWVCHKKYRRESCNDYTCDWSNKKSPTCKELPEGQSGMTKAVCEMGCKPQNGIYRCNNQTFQCEKCNIKYCMTDADCPNSYCQVDHSKPGPYVCHDSDTEGCKDFGHCNATCGAPLIGTWRGIDVSNNFVRGEFDFSAYSDGTILWRDTAGMIHKGTMHAGDQSAVSQGQAIKITVNSTVTLKGLYELDSNGDDSIVNNAFLAFSASKQVTSFDDGMTNAMEFILLTCDEKSGAPCDFSKSSIPESGN